MTQSDQTYFCKITVVNKGFLYISFYKFRGCSLFKIGCRLCKVRLQVLDCYGRFGRRECWWLVMHLAPRRSYQVAGTTHRLPPRRASFPPTLSPGSCRIPLSGLDWTHSSLYGSLRGSFATYKTSCSSANPGIVFEFPGLS